MFLFSIKNEMSYDYSYCTQNRLTDQNKQQRALSWPRSLCQQITGLMLQEPQIYIQCSVWSGCMNI